MNTANKNSLPWLVILGGCGIVALTFGPRSVMGLLQLPMLQDRGWERADFGLAMAIQNLMWGLGVPVFGAIADRYGTWRVLTLSGVLYALGLTAMAWAPTPTWLLLSGGVLVGLGIASGTYGIVLAAFARRVPPEKRSLVFGIGTAAGSAGMFIFAPVTQMLIDAAGWKQALVWLGGMMLAIPVLGIPLAGNSRTGAAAKAEFEQTVGAALREAFQHKSYVLLTTGFFVCGFHLAFITAHFPAYLRDIGIEARYAVIALALIGFFNIIGALAAGIIGQKYSKPYFLALIYLARSGAVAAFVLAPANPLSVILFAAAMGLLWLSTVPPTNALVAIMFGTRHLGLLGGIVFLSHQIGSFIGVWLGGKLYDIYGSYELVWWISVALGLFAAIVHWPIREEAVARPAAA